MNGFHSTRQIAALSKATVLSLNAIILFAAATVFVAAKPDKTADAKQVIQTELSQMDQAFQKKNGTAYVKFTADDFVSINAKGALTIHSKEERRREAQDGFDGADQVMENLHVTARTKIIRFAMEEKGAVVTENNVTEFIGVTYGRQHTARAVRIDRSLWVKRGKGWLEKQSKNISFHRTLDGQPSL